MSTYHPSNEFDTPTPMPKHPCPCNEPSKDNFTIALTNQASPQPYSPPLIDLCITRVSQAQSPPQSDNQTQSTQSLFPYHEPSKEDYFMAPSNQASSQAYSPPLINPYIASVLQAQTSSLS
nr:hypothetical protein [Tanacetum cinerariifolium]